MKILFLYAEVTGYLMGCLRELRTHPQVSEIRVYQALKQPENDFRIIPEKGIEILNAIDRSAEALWPEIAAFAPDVVFVSGWMFRKYYQLAKKLRATGAVLIIGNDTPWYGTLRQRIGAASSPFWISSLYDYMWVPGAAQYTFARRLGFSPGRIQTGLLSADVASFRQETGHSPEKPIKTLLSVGRFVPQKGMLALYKAFETLLEEGLTGWELHLVGSGPQAAQLRPAPRIRITPFVQPFDMPRIFSGADAFALASFKEPWGVVVHEASCAGLPLLLSHKVSAGADLLREAQNGFFFNPRSPEDLLQQMRRILLLPKEELQKMGAHSALLSTRYSPEIWAEKLVQMGLSKQKSRS